MSHSSVTLFLSLLFPFCLLGQTPAPAPAPAPTAPAAQPAAGPVNTGSTSAPPAAGAKGGPAGSGGGNSSKGGDPATSGKLPFFDPGSETVSWDGRHWNVSDNRVFRARFEKYLAAPAANSAEDLAYRKTIEDILSNLSPHNPGGSNLPRAVALLKEAAIFPIDAKLCDSLANCIWGVWQARKNVASLNTTITEMKNRQKSLQWNFEVGSTPSATKAGPRPATAAQGGGNKGGGGGVAGDIAGTNADGTRVAGYLKDMIEMEAKVKANELSIGVTETAARIEFQAVMIQFFLQRRFEHVVMATRFYRNLFANDKSTLDIKEGSDVEKMFSSGLGMNPTVGTLDTFASEAIRDVDESIQSFENLIEKNELDSASKRLSEAFITGEYLHRVRALENSKKDRVKQYILDGNQLLSTLEVRDYTRGEELIARMRKVAQDFDYVKANAAVTAGKMESNMHLQAAKNSMMRGDEATAATHLRAAAEAWPTNPRIQEAGEMAGKVSDVQNQALIDFDRLLSQKNYRQIFADQVRYAVAVQGDAQRSEQLKQIITDMSRVTMTLTVARETAAKGNAWAAYEAVEKAYLDNPEDTEISRLRSDLAVQASDFVSALKTAADYENRGQNGSALAYYFKARKFYQTSEFASDGVKRLLTKVKPRQEASGQSSQYGGGNNGNGDLNRPNNSSGNATNGNQNPTIIINTTSAPAPGPVSSSPPPNGTQIGGNVTSPLPEMPVRTR